MSTIFMVVYLLVFTHRIHGLQDVSCNFAEGQCEWHTDKDLTLQWTHNGETFWDFGPSNSGVSGSGYHMELDMTHEQANATGRLLSPNITGSVHQTCQLRIVYALEDHTACQLSVWLRTGTKLTSLPVTLLDTYQFDKSPYFSVPCAADTYQIIIEGKKMSERPCGQTFDKIGIASIQYYINQTTGEGSMTGAGDVDNKVTQSGQEEQRICKQDDADEPLPDVSKWAFAGIAIAVYTAILIVCVVLFCLLRKFICRRRSAGNSEKREQVICSFSNSKLNSTPGAASALNDLNPYSLPDEKQGEGQTTRPFHTPTDTASPYAVGGGAYEEAVKRFPPLPLAPSGSQDYNRLGEQPANRAGIDVRPKIYDHANDTTGAYSTTNMVSKHLDQQRQMAAVQYSHLQRNQEYV